MSLSAAVWPQFASCNEKFPLAAVCESSLLPIYYSHPTKAKDLESLAECNLFLRHCSWNPGKMNQISDLQVKHFKGFMGTEANTNA